MKTKTISELISTPLSGIDTAQAVYNEHAKVSGAMPTPEPVELKSEYRDWAEWDAEHEHEGYAPSGWRNSGSSPSTVGVGGLARDGGNTKGLNAYSKEIDGNTYTVHADPNLVSGKGAINSDTVHVEVRDPDGKVIGQTSSNYSYGYKNLPAETVSVYKYEVAPENQRQGIAGNMMKAIHEVIPAATIAHHSFVSEAGAQFANAQDPKYNKVLQNGESKFGKPQPGRGASYEPKRALGKYTKRDWAEWDAEHPYIPKDDNAGAAKPTDDSKPNGDTWGNWTKADPDEVRQGKIDELTGRIMDQNKTLAARDPDRLNAFIAQQVDLIKPTTDWKLPSGATVSITNGVRSTPAQQKELMDTVEKLTNKYPQVEGKPPLTVNILDSKSATKLMGRANGATIEGGTQVWIAPKVFAKDANDKMDEMVKSGWVSPAGAGHSNIEYTMTHEFGHTLDAKDGPNRAAVRDVMTPKSQSEYMPATSRYGKTDTAERYAEAFTEHELSNGTTEMALPQAIAPVAGWKTT